VGDLSSDQRGAEWVMNLDPDDLQPETTAILQKETRVGSAKTRARYRSQVVAEQRSSEILALRDFPSTRLPEHLWEHLDDNRPFRISQGGEIVTWNLSVVDVDAVYGLLGGSKTPFTWAGFYTHWYDQALREACIRQGLTTFIPPVIDQSLFLEQRVGLFEKELMARLGLLSESLDGDAFSTAMESIFVALWPCYFPN